MECSRFRRGYSRLRPSTGDAVTDDARLLHALIRALPRSASVPFKEARVCPSASDEEASAILCRLLSAVLPSAPTKLACFVGCGGWPRRPGEERAGGDLKSPSMETYDR